MRSVSFGAITIKAEHLIVVRKPSLDYQPKPPLSAILSFLFPAIPLYMVNRQEFMDVFAATRARASISIDDEFSQPCTFHMSIFRCRLIAPLNLRGR